MERLPEPCNPYAHLEVCRSQGPNYMALLSRLNHSFTAHAASFLLQAVRQLYTARGLSALPSDIGWLRIM